MLNATLKRSLILWAVATAMVASLGLAGAQTAARQDQGALISMTLKGTVGVLLDEVPPGQWRETAAQNALQKKVAIRSGWTGTSAFTLATGVGDWVDAQRQETEDQ